MKKYALIVAGGKGLRMGAELPKQFLPIAGKPLLMHTLEAFAAADSSTEIILVLPDSHRDYWQMLCDQHRFMLPITLARGGETRFHSVKNGLACVEEGSIVAIHDGVRPLASTDLINRSYEGALLHQGVIPTVALIDSIREIVSQEQSVVADRSRFLAVQTPQTFLSSQLKSCYDQPYNDSFTDDASVFEAAGFQITCIEGERENIKITTPFDLLIAETLIQNR